jgi:hypothetical protein
MPQLFAQGFLCLTAMHSTPYIKPLFSLIVVVFGDNTREKFHLLVFKCAHYYFYIFAWSGDCLGLFQPSIRQAAFVKAQLCTNSSVQGPLPIIC